MFSPSFAFPLLPVHGAPWSRRSRSVPWSLQSWIFQQYTDEISIENSVSTYRWGQLARTSHRSLSVCLSACAGPTYEKKKRRPSEFPDPVGLGLFNDGTCEQHGGPPRGPEQAETFMEPVSLSQSFPVRAGDCWVTFADSCGYRSLWK